MIGHSAGGWLATLLIYTDPRVGACAASSGTWLWRWSQYPRPRALMGLNVPKPLIPGLGKWGDQDDVLAFRRDMRECSYDWLDRWLGTGQLRDLSTNSHASA